jgi:hypothetical protein
VAFNSSFSSDKVMGGSGKPVCSDAVETQDFASLPLDPNIVQKAKDDNLADVYRRIDAPLLPIFLHPLSDAHLEQLKQRWQDLRYSRVDLWRQVAGNNPLVETRDFASQNPASASLRAKSLALHLHYLLARRSLAQLLSQVWAVAASPPDYYRDSTVRLIDWQKHQLERRAQAYDMEKALERQRSKQSTLLSYWRPL